MSETPIPPPPLSEWPPRAEEVRIDSRPASEMPRLSLSMFEPEALAPLFFWLLFTASIVAIGYLLIGFLADIVLSFILVSLASRGFRALTGWLRGRRVLASIITTMSIALLVVGPVAILGYTMAIDAMDAYGSASALLQNGGTALIDRLVDQAQALGLPASHELALSYAEQIAESVQSHLVDWGGAMLENALSITVHMATILVMVFYLLLDGERLRDYLYDLSPLPDNEDALLVETFLKVARGVVVGNGLGSLIQGVLGGAAMAFVGFSSPVLWGSVMFLFAFLPLIGVSAVSIPAALYLMLTGHPLLGLGFWAFCSVQGFIVENIVKTRLMGSAMRMHDMMVFLSILGGISAFGVIGIVYGPLVALLFMTLSDLYRRRYRPHLARQLAMQNADRSRA